MRWLGQNKIEGWIIAFLVVVVILMLLAAVGFLSGRWYIEPSAAAPQGQVDLYGDVSPDAKLLPLDRKALDDAYYAHLIKLWTIWLTDGAKDATRIRNGLKITRGAYHQAAESIAKREQEMLEQERQRGDQK
jgi:hypothetical protein